MQTLVCRCRVSAAVLHHTHTALLSRLLLKVPGVQSAIAGSALPKCICLQFDADGHLQSHLLHSPVPAALQQMKSCAGNHRKLRVTAQPNVTLTLEHVPQHCRRAKTILLGPLTPTDLDAAAFVHQQHGTLAAPSCMRQVIMAVISTVGFMPASAGSSM